MTTNKRYGTISTRGSSDKNERASKESDVIGKMHSLLGSNKVRVLDHANRRMAQRNIIYYEVLQALSNGKYDPQRDRFSKDHQCWNYSIEGKTNDGRPIRVGISFETVGKGEKLLVITVISPGKGT